jgi:hypothetical protein
VITSLSQLIGTNLLMEGRTTSGSLTTRPESRHPLRRSLQGRARCEYRGEKAFCMARPDTPSLSNLPVHPLEI